MSLDEHQLPTACATAFRVRVVCSLRLIPFLEARLSSRALLYPAELPLISSRKLPYSLSL